MPPLNHKLSHIAHIYAREISPGAQAGIIFGVFVGVMLLGYLGARLTGRR
jgi:hypothetical protein